MELDTPIVVPAAPEIIADKMLASMITIVRNASTGNYSAYADLQFYSEDEQGNKSFAIENGNRKSESLQVPDVLAMAANVPSLAIAFTALEQAIADMRVWANAHPQQI